MPKTFEPNKNADQLGIDKTRKFVVVETKKPNSKFNIGDVIVLERDDGTEWPTFRRISDGLVSVNFWSRLAYADDEPEKLAVHCPTRADYDRLMEAYGRKGWNWKDGTPTVPKIVEWCLCHTVIEFKDSFCRMPNDAMTAENYSVITVDEALRRLGEKVTGWWMLEDGEMKSIPVDLGSDLGCSVVYWNGKTSSYEKVKPFNERKKTLMQNIVQKIKDLALTETDRALRRNGFEDEQGKLTNTAEQMMLQEIVEERWKARREDVAAKLKQVEEEAKK